MSDVLTTLRRDGFVTTTAPELFGADLWAELQAATTEQMRVMAPLLRLTKNGQILGQFRGPGSRGPDKGSFLVKLLGERPQYDPASIWIRIAEHPAVVQLAADYLEAVPHLKAYNLWYTVASGAKPPRDSQLWHRDEDDVRMFKVFVYLTDVGLEAGPLHYVCGTPGRQGGPAATLDYARVPRATDAQMAAWRTD